MKNWISLLHIALAVLSLPLQALETTADKSLRGCWDAPTTRENGDSLPFSELSHYTLSWACDVGLQGSARVEKKEQLCVDLPANLLGHCTLTVSSTDTDGLISRESTPVDIFIKLNKPARGGLR